LVLDVRLAQLSGLDFQRQLAGTGVQIPIIFITAHGDIPMSVRTLKSGAVEFLTKPFRDQDLLDAIQQALQRDRAAREQQTEIHELKQRYQSLTVREREVMTLVVSGTLNKQIASEIGASEATLKIHRGHVMQKMGAGSLGCPNLVSRSKRHFRHSTPCPDKDAEIYVDGAYVASSESGKP